MCFNSAGSTLKPKDAYRRHTAMCLVLWYSNIADVACHLWPYECWGCSPGPCIRKLCLMSACLLASIAAQDPSSDVVCILCINSALALSLPQATPFVSGIALALRNLYPTLKAVDIKNAIINSATKAPQTLNNVTIGNIIDTQAALTAAAIAAGQNPGPTSGNSPGPSKPPTPSPSPPNPAKCTSADCATTDLPICVPAIGCVRIGDPATCSQTCQDQFDPASYDEYCYSPCTTSNPDDCTPTPTPTRTGCVTYDHWGTRYTGICDGQGMCVGECLEDADCRIKNPQKPLCMLYAGSPQDNDFQPSVCVEVSLLAPAVHMIQCSSGPVAVSLAVQCIMPHYAAAQHTAGGRNSAMPVCLTLLLPLS